MKHSFLIFFILTGINLAETLHEHTNPVVTKDDYARAESFLSTNTTPLVTGITSNPTWLPDGRLWYRNRIPEGMEFVLVDPFEGTRKPAFNHARLAKSLTSHLEEECNPYDLPFDEFEFSEDNGSILLESGDIWYQCDLNSYQCSAIRGGRPEKTSSTIVSPNGKKAAFIRDYNLWIRDHETGEETQLTVDGSRYFGYATNNAGWTKRDQPVLLWSQDSKKIATFQHDGRGVEEMYLVSTEVGHPRLEVWKYPLPGDTHIFTMHRVVIHLDGPRIVRLEMPPDPHRSTISDHVAARGGGWLDVEWSADSSTLAFVSSSRDHKQAKLRLADPETGQVRDVMEETVETFFESGNGKVNWHFLIESNEIIWFSQRDNWGHLYLYDLNSGRLKHRITEGSWNVLQLLRIDQKKRKLYFTGSGRETGDPYFHYFYSVGMDGSDLKLLTPEKAHHSITLAIQGTILSIVIRRQTSPPVSVLRDSEGQIKLTLEEADISRLVAKGWQPPIPIKVKARDGKTDLFGLMYKPTNFDPSKQYPILNYIYPGPQTGSVGSRVFRPSRSDKQSLAELGFIVVEIDAMGTPGRSKAFHTAYYGNMGDNGLPDQIAALKELASRFSWMDISRVGVWGHSGGGFASTDAILRYPDFYKVAVSGAGNHDNRCYEDDWGEKWQGLMTQNQDGTTNYDNQANQLLAANLKGKLLLAHGTMDSNVPPYNTMLVVDALIKANKDFDLILFPNRGHGFGNTPYMMRQRWDYFVRHLLGAEPPQEYEFTTDTRRR